MDDTRRRIEELLKGHGISTARTEWARMVMMDADAAALLLVLELLEREDMEASLRN